MLPTTSYDLYGNKNSKITHDSRITTDKAPINGLVKPFLDTIPINNAVEISCKMLLILFSSDTSVDGCFRQNTIKYVKQAVNSHSAPKRINTSPDVHEMILFLRWI